MGDLTSVHLLVNGVLGRNVPIISRSSTSSSPDTWDICMRCASLFGGLGHNQFYAKCQSVVLYSRTNVTKIKITTAERKKRHKPPNQR